MSKIVNGQWVTEMTSGATDHAYAMMCRGMNGLDRLFGVYAPHHCNAQYIDWTNRWWATESMNGRVVELLIGDKPPALTHYMGEVYLINRSDVDDIFFHGSRVLVYLEELMDGQGALALLDINKCVFSRGH